MAWLKLTGKKDWKLKPIILDGDWTFVTKNSADFRGPRDKPGSKGQYADVAIHAGVVCLNGPQGMDLDMQLELFGAALDALEEDVDLVNKVLEVTIQDDDTLRILRYALPRTRERHGRSTKMPPCRGLHGGSIGWRRRTWGAAPPIRRISGY